MATTDLVSDDLWEAAQPLDPAGSPRVSGSLAARIPPASLLGRIPHALSMSEEPYVIGLLGSCAGLL